MAKRTIVKFNDALFKKRVWSKILIEQTKRLEKYAQKELSAMATNHTFQNKTYNLQDSLVWGVFFEGHLRSYGFYGSGKASEPSFLHEWGRNPSAVFGRAEANAFITSYTPESTNGWEVVWAAAAPYSIYLDPLAGNTKTNRFYVISQEYDAIKQTFSKGRVTFKTL